MRLFITGTGTGVGKTVFTTALALALREAGRDVAALKPIETGCAESVGLADVAALAPRDLVGDASPAVSDLPWRPDLTDARRLALASGRPELADCEGFYRARLPLAPYAATLAGEAPPPPLSVLAGAVRAASTGTQDVLVEGAGGPLVPYDRQHVLLDLASELELPIVLVAMDALGVLSHTLCAVESIASRGLELAAVVLNRPVISDGSDPSVASNAQILEERLPPLLAARDRSGEGGARATPIVRFAPESVAFEVNPEAASKSKLALVNAIRASGLLSVIEEPERSRENRERRR